MLTVDFGDNVDVNAEDAYMLALTAWREARSEGAVGMLAVMQVICERVRDSRWPNTVGGVVLQSKQFSCWNAGDPNSRVLLDDNTLPWRLASLTLQYDMRQGKRLVWTNARPTHYHAKSITPGWTANMALVGEIGAHVFWREE